MLIKVFFIAASLIMFFLCAVAPSMAEETEEALDRWRFSSEVEEKPETCHQSIGIDGLILYFPPDCRLPEDEDALEFDPLGDYPSIEPPSDDERHVLKQPGWSAVTFKEYFLDVFIGFHRKGEARVGVDILPASGIREEYTREIPTETSLFGGLRLVRRFDRSERNSLAYEAFFLSGVNTGAVNGSSISYDSRNLGMAWLYGLPIKKSAKHPYGLIVPYLGLGLAISQADMDVDFTPYVSSSAGGSTEGVALSAMAGLRLPGQSRTGVYLEYRYVHLDLHTNSDKYYSAIDASINATIFVFGFSSDI